MIFELKKHKVFELIFFSILTVSELLNFEFKILNFVVRLFIYFLNLLFLDFYLLFVLLFIFKFKK